MPSFFVFISSFPIFSFDEKRAPLCSILLPRVACFFGFVLLILFFRVETSSVANKLTNIPPCTGGRPPSSGVVHQHVRGFVHRRVPGRRQHDVHGDVHGHNVRRTRRVTLHGAQHTFASLEINGFFLIFVQFKFNPGLVYG